MSVIEATKKLYNRLKTMKKDQFLILVLTGILLLVVTLPVGKEQETAEGTETANKREAYEESGSEDAPDYLRDLEHKLEQGLTRIEGVGAVKVMITLKSGEEQVILKDQTERQASTIEKDLNGGNRTALENETAETTIYTDLSDGTTVPYVVRTMVPKPEGVTVICQGADDAVVRENITEVVKALFPIEVHKIKVVRMAVTKTNSGKETMER